MDVEKTHEGEMICDFLTALEQEMAQGDALVQAELFRSSSIDETCENELKCYIAASCLPLRSKQKHNNSLAWWIVSKSLFPISCQVGQAFSSHPGHFYSIKKSFQPCIKKHFQPQNWIESRYGWETSFCFK